MSNRDGAATTPELNALHDEFAKKLKTYLKEGETVVIAGKEHKTSCSAAMMNVIRGFLKDNRIEAGTGQPSAAVGSLADQLAEFDALTPDEDEAPHFN